MSRTNEELEGVYKQGLPSSHQAGLREVYQLGRQDEDAATRRNLDVANERIADLQKQLEAAQHPTGATQPEGANTEGLSTEKPAEDAKGTEEPTHAPLEGVAEAPTPPAAP